MSSAPYQALPRDDYHNDKEHSPTHPRYTPEHRQLAQDPRFNPPTPSWWKRALLILFVIVTFWLYFTIRPSIRKEAQTPVIHAHRCVQYFYFFLYVGCLLFPPKILNAAQVSPRGQPRHL